MKGCAARIGSLLNYADIARDCDISLNTAKSWISVLEFSYIIKLLYPYYRNFNKRVIKSPKLYFYRSGEDLVSHPMRGHLFESFVLSECFKYFFHRGVISPPLYFWRDVQGHEIDLLLECSFDFVIPVEIKSRVTLSEDFFKGLREWIAMDPSQKSLGFSVIYAGKEDQSTTLGNLFSWKNIADFLDTLRLV